MLDFKKMSENYSADYCKGWNDAVYEFIKSNNRFSVIKCIRVSDAFAGKVYKGAEYFLDKTSVRMDDDGLVLGYVYGTTNTKEPIGLMNISNFKSVT